MNKHVYFVEYIQLFFLSVSKTYFKMKFLQIN